MAATAKVLGSAKVNILALLGTAQGAAGATGTIAWADPATQVLCVILTSRPLALDNGRLLRLVSNTVAASVQQVPPEHRPLATK